MHLADMAMEALRECQSALAMMIAPNAIKQTTVISAFAQATAAEAKARNVLSALASSPETARDRAERRVAELQAAGLHTLGDIERAQSSGERAGQSFQARVQPWMLACFGEEISRDQVELNHRFLEEALELVQANGCTLSEAHQLVDYTFGRPAGEVYQEIGGVMVTLAALCLAIDQDMDAAAETELARIWTKVDKIRAKQAAKPKHSPLPEHPALSHPQADDGWRPMDSAEDQNAEQN